MLRRVSTARVLGLQEEWSRSKLILLKPETKPRLLPDHGHLLVLTPDSSTGVSAQKFCLELSDVRSSDASRFSSSIRVLNCNAIIIKKKHLWMIQWTGIYDKVLGCSQTPWVRWGTWLGCCSQDHVLTQCRTGTPGLSPSASPFDSLMLNAAPKPECSHVPPDPLKGFFIGPASLHHWQLNLVERSHWPHAHPNVIREAKVEVLDFVMGGGLFPPPRFLRWEIPQTQEGELYTDSRKESRIPVTTSL